MSQIVQVVSMLLVIMREGDTVFQSKLVRGAVCSGVLELLSNAKGVSFEEVGWGGLDLGVMELEGLDIGVSAGRDHNLK